MHSGSFAIPVKLHDSITTALASYPGPSHRKRKRWGFEPRPLPPQKKGVGPCTQAPPIQTERGGWGLGIQLKTHFKHRPFFQKGGEEGDKVCRYLADVGGEGGLTGDVAVAGPHRVVHKEYIGCLYLESGILCK